MRKNPPVVILAYNRPKYLDKCLNSLKGQLNGRSVHLFIDGPRSHEDSVLIQQSISLARQKISNIEIHPSPQHSAPHLLNKRSRDYIFEEHDKAIFISDNLELNSYYLDQLEDLYSQLRENDVKVGMVSCLSGRKDEIDPEKIKNKTCFFPTSVGYLMTRDCYDKIFDDLDEYYSIVQDYYRADIHSLRSKFEVGNRFDGSIQQMTILAMSRNDLLFVTTPVNHGKFLDFPDVPSVNEKIEEFDVRSIDNEEYLSETIRYFKESKDYREFQVEVF